MAAKGNPPADRSFACGWLATFISATAALPATAPLVGRGARCHAMFACPAEDSLVLILPDCTHLWRPRPVATTG